MADLIRSTLHVGSPQRAAAEKALGKGRSAEDLVRHLTFCVIASQAQWYGSWRSFPKLAKSFGVDADKVLQGLAPTESKKAPAKPAKKRR